MRKTRVLIVDDAVVVRRLVSQVLSAEPETEVVGSAANGRIALAKIPLVNPDVVLLDVEMPEMDGLETLAAIRKRYPLLPVIMFSSLTQRGAVATLDALSLGANDYITKPANAGPMSVTIQRLREELILKFQAFCPREAEGQIPGGLAEPFPATFRVPSPAAPSGRRPTDVVAIGASTGGPNALAALLPQLPADFPVPLLIVQHMPPIFTKFLADRLASQSAIPVREAVAGKTLQPGCAWVAPGDYHLVVVPDGDTIRLQVHQGPPENSSRPAVDVLFRSVADVYGPRALGVVLTGMGQDGLAGCQRLREAGGQVLVQDAATSVVWGMPGYVAGAGLADSVLPLDRLVGEITRRVSEGRKGPLAAGVPEHHG